MHGVSLRIGVNAGSLDPAPAEEVRPRDARGPGRVGDLGGLSFEENDFHDFKISVKHHDVLTMVQAYRMLSEAGRLAAAPGCH